MITDNKYVGLLHPDLQHQIEHLVARSLIESDTVDLCGAIKVCMDGRLSDLRGIIKRDAIDLIIYKQIALDGYDYLESLVPCDNFMSILDLLVDSLDSEQEVLDFMQGLIESIVENTQDSVDMYDKRATNAWVKVLKACMNDLILKS